ncbi:CrcB family protein [Quadrisphaera sp. DSM 44207]|uniref:fluoride efflux transporter FluC n=1 Tax=Quadrisphaera sp. DSM 44207 TaxID=1881057 RepID=UPI00087F3DD8|nr:CrcB family protein [Quadrisphaera sp. DSM 44207]SDQ13799.1 camphor resistance protein CrcB [Quadrisphaera sp. DSM 44207]
MSALLVLALAAAGGAGACLRHLVDTAVTAAWARRATRRSGAAARRGARSAGPPVSTLAVNAAGSLLIGLLTEVALRSGDPDPGWLLVLGAGACGGFTTFGTPCWQALVLLQQRRRGAAAAVAALNLVISTAAAALGLAAA